MLPKCDIRFPLPKVNKSAMSGLLEIFHDVVITSIKFRIYV